MNNKSVQKEYIKRLCEQYVYPFDLFDNDKSPGTTLWTCVRTRPQWEKRFARFLHSQRMAYYLPTVSRTTCSGRKSRTTTIPLFPGYIFLNGNNNKQLFKESGSVLCVIRPRIPLEEKILDQQIRAVWRITVDGAHAGLGLETDFKVGDKVKILSGSLSGLSGEVIIIGKSKKLVVWIDMLGVGVSVVINRKVDLLRLDAPAPAVC